MRVKMRAILASPQQNAQVGDVIEVSAERGKALVEGGYAVYQPAAKVTAPSAAELAKQEDAEAQKRLMKTEAAAMEPGETPEGEPQPKKRRGRPPS